MYWSLIHTHRRRFAQPPFTLSPVILLQFVHAEIRQLLPWSDLIYVLSLPVEHRPQSTDHFSPSSSLPCAATFILQLYNPTVPISDSISLLQVFFGCPRLLWRRRIHSGALFGNAAVIFFAIYVQANSIFFFSLCVPVLGSDQFLPRSLCRWFCLANVC